MSELDSSVSDKSQDGWILRPDEIVATFFLALPEQLTGLVGQTFTEYEFLDVREFAKYESSGMEFGVAPCDPQPDSELEIVPSHVFRSSVLLHEAASNENLVKGVASALAVANYGSGKRKYPSHGPIIVPSMKQKKSEIRNQASQGVGLVMIAEVAIPLRLIGDIPTLPTNLEEDLNSIPGLEPFRRGLPESVPTPSYVAMSLAKSTPTDLVRGRLSAALHLALLEVRRIQRAYYSATYMPLTLVSREGLPHMVPVLLRHRKDLGRRKKGRELLLHPHENYWSIASTSALTDEQRAVFSTTHSLAHPRPTTNMQDFRREAEKSLYRNGDTRGAAIYTALAAENFLDQVLLHLFWEQSIRPEDAADTWRRNITDRVRGVFPTIVGGSWDTSQPGPVGDWLNKVAHLRNSVVHIGSIPTYEQCAASLEAYEGLTEFVCDRLCEQKNLRRFPRTALTFSTRPGMRRRAVYTTKVQEIEADPAEPNWNSYFARWVATFRRCRQDKVGDPRSPKLAGSRFIALITREQCQYLAYDESACMGVSIEIDESSRATPIVRELRKIAPVEGDALVMEIESTNIINPSLSGGWVEAYRLFPDQRLMLNGQDV